MLASIKKRITHFLDHRSPSHEERLCVIIYYVGLFMYMVGVPLHFLGFIGIRNNWLLAASGIAWVLCLVSAVLYGAKRMSLRTSASLLAFALQLVQSVRIVYQAVACPEDYVWTIVLNQIISLTIVVFLVIAFLTRQLLVNTIISLATLLFAFLWTHGEVDRQVLYIFSFVEVCVCGMGCFMHRSVHQLQQENADYQNTQQGLLDAFHMTRTELLAYVQLCRQKHPDEQSAKQFFAQLDEQAEANLIRMVEQRVAERNVEKHDFKACFTDFTPTEIEVCRLVVQGHTLAQIAQILNKTTNNISTVRIHIRRKLHLTPSDNLREVLTARMKDGQTGK